MHIREVEESLEKARELFSSSLEARCFARSHLASIVDHVLELRHDRVEKAPKCRVERILRAALEIANEGLIDNFGDAQRRWPLRVLATIFDKSKPYYADPLERGATAANNNNSAPRGRPEVRVAQVKAFHRIGGFENLASYLSSPSGAAADEYFSILHPLLAAAYENVSVSKERGIDASSDICEAIARNILNLNEGALTSLPTRLVEQACEDLQRLNRRLAFSGRQSLSDFHGFWRSLALRLIRSPARLSTGCAAFGRSRR